MSPNPQEIADLVTFTEKIEEIDDGKLHIFWGDRPLSLSLYLKQSSVLSLSETKTMEA